MKGKIPKILIFVVLICSSLFFLVSCGNSSCQNKVSISNKHKQIIEKSIEAVKVEWNRELNERNIDNKEIKIANTIIHELKKEFSLDDFKKELGDKENIESYYRNFVDIFGDADYLVEFVILVDVFGSGIHREITLYNNCLVGKNGYKVESYILDLLSAATYTYKYPFIEKTIDYGSAFDRTIDVTK